jgi:hypothetical protein
LPRAAAPPFGRTAARCRLQCRDAVPRADPPHRRCRPQRRPERGATFNPGNRFAERTREPVDDGWAAHGDEDSPSDAAQAPPKRR